MEEKMKKSENSINFSKIVRSSHDSAYESLNSNVSHCWSMSDNPNIQLSTPSLFETKPIKQPVSDYLKPDNDQSVQLPSNIRNTENKVIFGHGKNHDKDLKKRRFKPLMSRQLNTIPIDTFKNQEKYTKTSTETKSLQVAALSQALGFIDKFRQTQESKTDKSTGPKPDELYDLALNLQEAAEGVACALPGPLINPQQTKNVSKKVTEVFAKECIEKKSEEAFCSAVSLQDGSVIHTTSTITDILGYPKDMWMGRSFIDFIHPDDRLTFTSQIGSGMSLPLVENIEEVGKKNVDTRFCRIRKYNGLKAGYFAVKERKTTYGVFKLSVCFKNIENSGDINSHISQPNGEAATFATQATFLFITASPVNSAYLVPYDEGPFSREYGRYCFTTKHDVDCTFSMVEDQAISFLGFRPQDLQGQDIFKFYHPQDLLILKEAFIAVTTEQGTPFRSKPYRFMAKNNDYILLTTEFCSFSNPWSRQLEFIIGKHTVLKGPKDPNIFAEPQPQEECEADPEITTEILEEAKLIQEAMKHLLSKPVQRKLFNTDDIYKNSSKRRKQLTNFMETLLNQMAKYENKRKEGIITENNTVIVEEVSSKEDSLEMPPSYNQLNYNENITRFFNSEPKTLTKKEVMEEKKSNIESTSTENNTVSDDVERSLDSSNKHTSVKKTACRESLKYDEGRKGSRIDENQGSRNTDSPEGTGESSSIRVGLSVGNQGQTDHGMSQDGTCSGHGSQQSWNKEDNAENYKSPQLTEKVLHEHNQGMEKIMIDNYEQTRNLGFRKPKSSTHSKSSKKHNIFKSYDKNIPSKNSNKQPSTGRKEIPPDQNSWTLYDNKSARGQPNFNYSENMIGVPAIFIPPASHFVKYPNPPVLMVQTGSAYIPFATISPSAMGQRFYPPSYSALNPDESRIHQKKSQHQENSQLGSDNMATPKSCMVESHGTIKSKNVKFLIPAPETSPLPREHISDASDASLSMNIIPKKEFCFPGDHDFGQRRDSGNGSGSKHNSQESDSFSENEKPEKNMWKLKGNVRPVLTEPFWNENVTVNQELLFNYQLDVHEEKNVLFEDLEKLNMMIQPDDVNIQLEQLYNEVSQKGENLFATYCLEPAGDDDLTDESKNLKILQSNDMINIFFEDEIPLFTTHSCEEVDNPLLTTSKDGSNKEDTSCLT